MLKKLNSRDILTFSLIISLAAIGGSLYYSEIIGLKACSLCWYQRIFMYPLPIIILIGLFTNDKNSLKYLNIFSVCGAIIALYHYIIQITNQHSIACSIGEDCTSIQLEYLGFITLPLMSFVSFSLIFISSLYVLLSKKVSTSS